MKRFVTLIWMLVLLLAVTAAAVFYLDKDPLYLDERITIEHLGSASEVYTLAETSASIARFSEQHSPGYFWLMNGWSALVGFSPFVLRYFSVLLGLLSLAMLYRIADDWYNPLTGIMATGLLSAVALHLFYLHEARMYSQITLLLLFVMWHYRRMIRRQYTPTLPDWVLLAAGIAALIYTHYFTLFPLAGIGLYHLIFVPKDRRWWKICAVVVLAGLTFIPWLSVVFVGTEEVVQEQRTGLDALSAIFMTGWLFANRQIVLFGATILGSGLALRQKRIRLPLMIGLVTLAGLLLVNEFLGILPARRARYFLLVYPFFALIVARGLSVLPYRYILLPALLIGWAASGIQLHNKPNFDLYTNRDFFEQADFPPFAEATTALHSHDVIRTPDDLLFLVTNTTPGINTVQVYIAEFYGNHLNVNEQVIEPMTFSPDDTHSHYNDDSEYKLSLNPPVVYVALNPAKTDAAYLADIETRLQRDYTACSPLVQRDDFLLNVYVYRQAPCATVFSGENIDVQYQEEPLALRQVVQNQADNQLTVVTTWRMLDEMPFETYSYSLRIKDETDAYIATQDDAVPLGVSSWGTASGIARRDLMVFDTTDWNAGQYKLSVVVYNWKTVEPLTATREEMESAASEVDIGTFEVNKAE